MEIISIEEARQQGLKFYYTGIPCTKGNHLSLRYVSSRRCVSCVQQYEQSNKEQNRQRKREATERFRLKRTYGITKDQIQQIMDNQHNCCAICLQPLDTKKNHIHVDHCHATGRVRGILCRYCNHVLGNAKDNIQTLYHAITYLEKGRESIDSLP